jgi:hypothetical protein
LSAEVDQIEYRFRFGTPFRPWMMTKRRHHVVDRR